MTDLAKTLDELSKAATQGEWRIHSAMLGHKGDIFSPTAKQVKDCHHIARFYAAKPAKPVICELQALGVERDAIQQIEANTGFVAALVNAYRTGKLVVVPDDAVERITDAIETETVERQGRGIYLVTGHGDSTAFATAALAALKGADHAG